MKLEDLKKRIPFKWRVQSFSKRKPKAQCVAYIDARSAMDLLDDVCGADRWQDEYQVIHDHLYSRIGINVSTDLANPLWVWKGDCGIESNMEKEKGEASDAFKRAGVKWGIGRFLYAMKTVWVDANEIKSKTNFPHVVANGKRVWDLTEYINGLNGESPKADNKPKTVKFPTYDNSTPKNTEKPAKDKAEPSVFVINNKPVSRDRYIEVLEFNAKKHGFDLGDIVTLCNLSVDFPDMEDGEVNKVGSMLFKNITANKKK